MNGGGIGDVGVLEKEARRKEAKKMGDWKRPRKKRDEAKENTTRSTIRKGHKIMSCLRTQERNWRQSFLNSMSGGGRRD